MEAAVEEAGDDAAYTWRSGAGAQHEPACARYRPDPRRFVQGAFQ
jgi:hypothetical protein